LLNAFLPRGYLPAQTPAAKFAVTSCRWRRDLGAKSVSCFSIPSPSIAHKSGDLHRRATLPSTSLSTCAIDLPLCSPCTDACSAADFLVIGLQAGLDDLLDEFQPCPAGVFVASSPSRASRRRDRAGRIQRCGWRQRHAWICLPSAASSSSCRWIPAPRSRHLAGALDYGVVHVARHHALRLERSRPASVMFSRWSHRVRDAVSTVTAPTLAALIFSRSARHRARPARSS